jgi:hypothetical protein
VTTPAPRAIISESSSGSEETDMASSCEMTRRCTSVASDWLKVCMPYLFCPVCIIE